MKKNFFALLVTLSCIFNHAIAQLGEQAPDFTMTDLDGNTWNLQSLLESGKEVHLMLGNSNNESYYVNFFQWQYEEMNLFYQQYGPAGSDEMAIFYIDVNPDYGIDMIDGTNPLSWTDYTYLVDFPCVDGDANFLANYAFAINEIGAAGETGYQVHICPTGSISGFELALDLNYCINICATQIQGTDLGILLSDISNCETGYSIRFSNHGSTTINSIDYQILENDVVITTETWNGVLNPFNDIWLNNSYSMTSGTLTVEILTPDEEPTNNTATGEVYVPAETTTNHLRLRVENTAPEYDEINIVVYSNLGISSELYFTVDAGSEYVADFYTLQGCNSIELYLYNVGISYYQLVYVNADGSEAEIVNSIDNEAVFGNSSLVIYVNEMVPFDLVGSVFHDQNENGFKENDEPGIGGVQVSLGYLTTYTDANGIYTFPDVPIDEFSEVTITYDDVLWPTTTTGNTLPIDNGMMSTINFGLSNNEPFYQLTAYSWDPWFFCGFDGQLYFTVANDGNASASGTFTATLDPLLTYIGAYPAPSVFNGNTITWNLDNLPVGVSFYCYVDVVSPSFEQMGENLTTTLNTIAFDENGDEFNNTTTEFSGIVNCSYDPNDINGFPAGETDAHYIMNGTELEYLVRFQNTGNYQAFNIRVDDQLDSDLDFATFEFLGSSHACLPVFNSETGLIQFYFNDINLPDSTTDEAGSHGWLRYRVSPQNPLPEMTIIYNTAYIYFDFNPAVITNTYTHTVSDLYFSVEELSILPLILHPNPTDGVVNIQTDNNNQISTIRITDLQGKIVYTRSGEKKIDLSALAAGVYIVEAIGNNMIQRGRLVVE